MMIAPVPLSPGHEIVTDGAGLARMVTAMQSAKVRGFDFETGGIAWWNGQLPIGYSLGYLDRGAVHSWYVPFDHKTCDIQADPDAARQALADSLKGAEAIVGHNLKFDLNQGRADNWDIPLWVPLHDTMIQAYMIDETRRLKLEQVVLEAGCSPYGDPYALTNQHTGWIQMMAKDRRMGYQAYLDIYGHSEVPVGLEGEYACRDIGHTLALDQHQRAEAMGIGQWYEAKRRILYENEMLLVRALADMEYTGQLIDRDYLERLAMQLDQELDQGAVKLRQLFSTQIEWNNDNSVRQLLYEDLKFPVKGKTASGLPSVDKAALLELSPRHAGIEPLMDWRARYKIRSTYTTSLIDKLGPDNRIHASFVQTGAVSGRLSSKKPNLQNIPSRHKELAKRVRRAFIVEEGHSRLYSDYSQVELRFLGWCTGNVTFTDAYKSDAYDLWVSNVISYDKYRRLRAREDAVDAHGLVTQQVFGVFPGDADWKVKRSAAKIISFGVAYGAGWALLMNDPNLRLSETQAKAFFSEYHRRNPEINRAKKRLFRKMKAGELTFINWASRKRHGRRLVWADRDIVAEEERSLFASLISGSAAELTRFSLVKLWLAQMRGEMPAKSTSTVHDEIQLDCLTKDVMPVARDTQRHMEDFRGMFGTTPIIADLETTETNWSAKKELLAA